MEKEPRENEVGYSRRGDFLSEGLEPDSQGGISSPSWRGLVIAVVAAIVLSVTATLLLGRSFGLGSAVARSGRGAGSDCCAPVGKR
jgi:hypothetical protein